MTEVLTGLLKISLVIFMAGNLMDMGLKLNLQDAGRALGNVRFIALTLLWGFVVGPGLAYLIALVIPLEPPYAMGLILMGMTPCAPFLPMVVSKANGDIRYTAAFMLLASAATVIFMPIAVPVMVTGLTVSAWSIAKPLLLVVLLPLAVGMVILRVSASLATRIQPFVKGITGFFTIAMLVLCVAVYGKDLLGAAGSLAVAAQFIFFILVTTLPYWIGFGLPHEQKIVLSAGMATRNLGAALAPLLSVSDIDQRATIMVVLGLPTMVLFAMLATKWFGHPAAVAGPGTNPVAEKTGEDC